MDLVLGDVEAIKRIIVEPINERLAKIEDTIKLMHTPDSCDHLKDLTAKVEKISDQQKLWMGGMTVLIGIGGIIMTWLNIFRR